MPNPAAPTSKHRPTFGIVEVTALEASDCARIAGLRGPQDRRCGRNLAIVAAAPVSVPVFAAPEPGARLSSDDILGRAEGADRGHQGAHSNSSAAGRRATTVAAER